MPSYCLGRRAQTSHIHIKHRAQGSLIRRAHPSAGVVWYAKQTCWWLGAAVCFACAKHPSQRLTPMQTCSTLVSKCICILFEAGSGNILHVFGGNGVGLGGRARCLGVDQSHGFCCLHVARANEWRWTSVGDGGTVASGEKAWARLSSMRLHIGGRQLVPSSLCAGQES